MIKEIIHDPVRLSIRSVKAEPVDSGIAEDLLDTIKANADRCVGMAANMIGANKRIIVFYEGGDYQIMYNPVIVRRSELYKAEEGCLSLTGTRETKRYKTIKVEYYNAGFQKRTKTYTGFTAQIIQHEVDHCDGILI